MAPTPQRSTAIQEEDAIIRQALQAAHNPEAFLQMTLAELAASPPLGSAMEVEQTGGLTGEGSGTVNTTSPIPDLRIQQQKTNILPASTPRPVSSCSAALSASGTANTPGVGQPYLAKDVQGITKDPYMTSPSFPGKTSTVSPSPHPPAFGPVRHLRREAHKLPTRAPTTEVKAAGRDQVAADKLMQYVTAHIVSDDDDPVIEAADDTPGGLGIME